MKFARLLVERRSLVLDVAGRQKFSSRDRLDGSAHQHAVHDDVVANGEVPHGELMFGGNSLGQSVDLAFEFDRLASGQVGEGDQNVVAGIELEHGATHGICKALVSGRRGRATGPRIASGHCKTCERCTRLLTSRQPPKAG